MKKDAAATRLMLNFPAFDLYRRKQGRGDMSWPDALLKIVVVIVVIVEVGAGLILGLALIMQMMRPM
jgi:hypothetical protein